MFQVCLRPFGDPSNLNKHIRLHAEGDTPYRCQHCGKVLVRRRDLERHVRSRHPAEAERDGLVVGDTLLQGEEAEEECLQNSSGSGEARGGDTLLLGVEGVQGLHEKNPHPGPEGIPADHLHGDCSDSSSGTFLDEEDEDEDEEIEVVELENTESLDLDIRC